MSNQDLYLAIFLWALSLEALSGEDAACHHSVGDIRAIASKCGLSKSSCHRSLTRLSALGLVRTESEIHVVNAQALSGIFVHGVRYFFPAKLGCTAFGLPTAFSGPYWKANSSDFDKAAAYSPEKFPLAGAKMVWDAKGLKKGGFKGLSVEPLHPAAIEIAATMPKLHMLLSLCDVFRLGLQQWPADNDFAQNGLAEVFVQ